MWLANDIFAIIHSLFCSFDDYGTATVHQCTFCPRQYIQRRPFIKHLEQVHGITEVLDVAKRKRRPRITPAKVLKQDKECKLCHRNYLSTKVLRKHMKVHGKHIVVAYEEWLSFCYTHTPKNFQVKTVLWCSSVRVAASGLAIKKIAATIKWTSIKTNCVAVPAIKCSTNRTTWPPITGTRTVKTRFWSKSICTCVRDVVANFHQK